MEKRRILLTCGVGDFIAMDAYLTPAERASVTAIHWASRQRETLLPLMPFVFPNLTEHVIERDTWGPAFSKTFCIHSRAELPGLPADVIDWSVRVFVDEFRKRQREYHGSAIVAQQLVDVARLGLPAQYYVVHPYSENARTPIRDLSAPEWSHVYRSLKARAIPIVIVNRGSEQVPRAGGVIDLTNQLTLLEAIEVTKRAAGFIGAASLFSVVASKTIAVQRMFVKGSRDLQRNFATFYYAPHVSSGFIYDSLTRARL